MGLRGGLGGFRGSTSGGFPALRFRDHSEVFFRFRAQGFREFRGFLGLRGVLRGQHREAPWFLLGGFRGV